MITDYNVEDITNHLVRVSVGNKWTKKDALINTLFQEETNQSLVLEQINFISFFACFYSFWRAGDYKFLPTTKFLSTTLILGKCLDVS